MFNKWKKWNLSLIGKITVIKTLTLPKLIYLFTVLERPDESKIKTFKTNIGQPMGIF